MELKIEFGIDFEFKRVKESIAKLSWYTSKGYIPRLPRGITKESSESEIKKQISTEFNEQEYKDRAKEIKEDFSKIAKELSFKLKKIFNKNIPEIFLVYLTNYGVGGSYVLPNTIIFNINNRQGFKTIVHEIIHLIIEPYVQEYHVSHWEKERVVDLIFNSKELDFIEDSSWQKNYKGVEKYIDDLFDGSFFKNPGEFFSKIEHVRNLVD